MFTRISHIGVVVDDMERALRVRWRDELGFKQFSEAHFEVEGIRSIFLSLSGSPGEMSIELMEPHRQIGHAQPRRPPPGLTRRGLLSPGGGHRRRRGYRAGGRSMTGKNRAASVLPSGRPPRAGG
jgi:catechol 2,3-dioxygenase-like lactoylglutathione lyase family enzyme